MTQKRTISVRALSVIAFIALAVLLAPILISSVYNRPINDDLVQPYPAKIAFQETGSVFQTLLASVRETIRIWHDYSGIFSSMFLSVFAPYAFSYTLGFIHPILLSGLLILACYKLVQCLYLINKDIPSCYIHLLTPLLSITFLTTMPNITECLFWYSSAVNYLFFFCISLLLFSSVLKATFSNSISKPKSALLLAVYCAGFFFLGGSNWITSTSSIVVYGFLSLFILLQKKRRTLIIPFLFLLAGYGLAIIAPGNFNRQLMVGDQPSIVEAFVLAFFKALSFCFSKGSYYLFPLLMIPVLVRISHYVPTLPKCIWLLPVASVCIIASCFFPMVYTAYYITYRHENIICFIFTILLLINELVFISWLAQHRSTNYQKGEQFVLSHVAAIVFAFSLTVLSAFQTTFTLSPISLSSDYPPLQSAVHLLMGYTKNYATSYDDLVYTLQTTEEEEVILDSNLTSPIVGGTRFQWYADYWINTAFVKFYTDEETILLHTRW